jgi:hypothetical protein
MKKLIRDGRVAILYSPGFGAGWYTWNRDFKELLFHPVLVEMVEQNRKDEIEDWVIKNINEDIFFGGVYDLEIEWLPIGTAFTVEEYDGSESISTIDSLTIIA